MLSGNHVFSWTIRNRKNLAISVTEKKVGEMNRPIIAIPMGDPAGVGPEIIVKALCDESLMQTAKCLVIGDLKTMQQAMEICKKSLKLDVVLRPEDGQYKPGILTMIDLKNVDFDTFQFGKVSGMCGRAAYEYIEKSIALAMNKQVHAVATTPINKESLRAGEIPYIGHTEIFGELTNTKDPLTMFEARGMRVFFLSRHVSLREACDLVKKDRIKDYVKRCLAELKKLGVSDGTMAIAGLNPHCGEHGLFGEEEVSEVIPAVKELQEENYPVAGPIGADSVFHLALKGTFHSVLSLYHDQGHIATKTLDFERTIAITCGMPFLRTSVDHGTAFDIAGTGKASEISMKEAIFLATKYSSVW